MGSNEPPNSAIRLGWCLTAVRCACAVVNPPPARSLSRFSHESIRACRPSSAASKPRHVPEKPCWSFRGPFPHRTIFVRGIALLAFLHPVHLLYFVRLLRFILNLFFRYPVEPIRHPTHQLLYALACGRRNCVKRELRFFAKTPQFLEFPPVGCRIELRCHHDHWFVG